MMTMRMRMDLVFLVFVKLFITVLQSSGLGVNDGFLGLVHFWIRFL